MKKKYIKPESITYDYKPTSLLVGSNYSIMEENDGTISIDWVNVVEWGAITDAI